MENGYNSDNGNNSGRILRGHWRPEEDEKLRQLVLTYGAKNWNSIAESIEGRTGISKIIDLDLVNVFQKCMFQTKKV